jgi:ADP-heptose:LPS heptosyltransferase
MGSRADQLWEHPQSSDVIDGAHEGMSALETGSLVRHLDLVITVDTFVAHMAGALGVPTWILVARNPDWRWLGKGQRSHWYDSVRLFRQGESSQWAPVVQDVIKALQEEYPRTSNP